MFLSRSMPEDAIHIVNCFGCENIIECFVDPSIWLTYSFNGMRYQDGWVRAENLMIRYFDGENSQNEKLPFGCPMVTRIHPSEGPACESQLTFAAALPNKWAQVPQPRTDELTLSQWPKLHVYARFRCHQYSQLQRRSIDWSSNNSFVTEDDCELKRSTYLHATQPSHTLLVNFDCR
ncbi:hypothetical protein CRM22_008173 [Opisthorchis felineus]|uniref:Uncharacterized protein n=1 Tax=Opisthorchis felineus TaxID=147828 RepID=A0A4S2LCI1_OPIFE|nr:hypothetical protein CRM22_008173 [Opisthorchis felineus]